LSLSPDIAGDVHAYISAAKTTHQVSVIEHGNLLWRRLRKTLHRSQKYFDVIQSLLSYGSMEFSHFVIDTDASTVALKGKAKFTWLSTKESWNETFAYILDFDEKGKVNHYQIWADSGAAYLARIGKLDEKGYYTTSST
jgi:hypothetical protein